MSLRNLVPSIDREEPFTCGSCNEEYSGRKFNIAVYNTNMVLSESAYSMCSYCSESILREHGIAPSTNLGRRALFAEEVNVYIISSGGHTHVAIENTPEGQEDFRDSISSWGMLSSSFVRCSSSDIACQSCGSSEGVEVFPDGNRNRLCRSCTEQRLTRPIQNYTFKPSPIFHGKTGSPMMGVELEVTSRVTEHGEAAAKILKEANKFLKSYCKSDSSVCDGFELVTHPFTYDFAVSNKKKIRDVFDSMADAGVVSGREHDIVENGMHIHVSKDSLDDDGWIRFITIFYESPQFTWNISNRVDSDKFRRFSSMFIDSSPKVAWERQAIIPGERHTAINITDKTVEVRFFNATVDPHVFMSNIEIVHLAVRAALNGYSTSQSFFESSFRIATPHTQSALRFAKERPVSYGIIRSITSPCGGR